MQYVVVSSKGVMQLTKNGLVPRKPGTLFPDSKTAKQAVADTPNTTPGRQLRMEVASVR